MYLKIIVPGEPVAQARPRFTKKGKKPRAYDTDKCANYKNAVGMFAKHALKNSYDWIYKEGTILAVTVDICVSLEPPKSWSKGKKMSAISGDILPTTRPDCDNYAKTYLDAMTGILYKDDSNVVSLSVKKIYDYTSRAIIELTARELFTDLPF